MATMKTPYKDSFTSNINSGNKDPMSIKNKNDNNNAQPYDILWFDSFW